MSFLMKNFKLLFGGFFAVFGILFIIVGIAISASFARFKETALPVKAVITNIETQHVRRNNRNTTEHDVYVEYEVDGARYNERLGSYTSSMREGQEIDILYNPANPREIGTESAGLLFLLIFGGLGAVFFLIGGIFLALELRKRGRVKRIIGLGHPVTAAVTEISRDTSSTMKVNGRRKYPHHIHCEWTNPADGVRYEFESDDVWNLPPHVVSGDNMAISVTVYIDPSDPQQYHVAEDTLGGASAERP